MVEFKSLHQAKLRAVWHVFRPARSPSHEASLAKCLGLLWNTSNFHT